jgi:hypothetical protein
MNVNGLLEDLVSKEYIDIVYRKAKHTLNICFRVFLWTTTVVSDKGAHGGCDRSAENAYFSAALDPTFAFVGRLCCPTLDFVFAVWIMITFYTMLTL